MSHNKSIKLWIDSESSILSSGVRALANAAERIMKESKIGFEKIPQNFLEWRNASDTEFLKHDLILVTKSGSEYFMGCVTKSRDVHVLSEKSHAKSWSVMPKLLKNNVYLVKQKSLKRAKEKLKECVVRFLEDVQEA